MDEIQLKVSAYTVEMNRLRVKAGIELSNYVAPPGSEAVFAAGALPYYAGLRGIDALGKSDRYIASLPGRGFDDGQTVTPGHNKHDLYYSIQVLRPDVIYDALAWVRYDSGGILEFVQRHYVEHSSFWLRRDSRHVHWNRVVSR